MFSRILNIITTAILAFAILVAVLLGGVRILGFTPYAVTSGSMEPKYKVGSCVYVKHIDTDKIKEGDVITFRLTEDELATHRVIKIQYDENGSREFITKGDANNISDGRPVPAGNVVGKVYFTIPLLGYFGSFVTTTAGKGVIICGSLILLVLIGLESCLKRLDKEKGI